MYLKITTFDKEVNIIAFKVGNNLLKHLENLKNKVLQHKPGHQFSYFGKKSKNNENQFWKHDSHPFYLYSKEMIEQKVNYIHYNPVVAGFVNVSHEWRLSSANPNLEIKLAAL
jgi:hypothetical protein